MIDPQPLLRHGVRSLLEDSFEIEELCDRREAVELVQDVGHFELAIVDMQGVANGTPQATSGIDAIHSLRRAEPGLAIIAYGERAERHLASEALAAGASAYVSKRAGAEVLRSAIDAALEAEEFVDPAVPPKGSRGRLTHRQRQILKLLADGESTTFAAHKLGLSEETVKTHTKNIMARLGARNRAHAVAIAMRESLVD